MTKKNAVARLSTPSDLNEKGREKITLSLNPLVADAFALYVKTKSFHWHLSGSHFRDYHLLFDEQAGQIFEMIDPLAERVRKLGGKTICSVGHISRLQKIKDDDEACLDSATMLKHLMNDNKSFLSRIRVAHAVCEQYNDVATCSVLEVFIDETERRIWFLFETMAKN